MALVDRPMIRLVLRVLLALLLLWTMIRVTNSPPRIDPEGSIAPAVYCQQIHPEQCKPGPTPSH